VSSKKTTIPRSTILRWSERPAVSLHYNKVKLKTYLFGDRTNFISLFASLLRRWTWVAERLAVDTDTVTISKLLSNPARSFRQLRWHHINHLPAVFNVAVFVSPAASILLFQAITPWSNVGFVLTFVSNNAVSCPETSDGTENRTDGKGRFGRKRYAVLVTSNILKRNIPHSTFSADKLSVGCPRQAYRQLQRIARFPSTALTF
jgi:hypothetical protein